LISGLMIAAALTITQELLDNASPESFVATGCPLRNKSGSPSDQAMQSGEPSAVTGA
jgi:hypothetical protein